MRKVQLDNWSRLLNHGWRFLGRVLGMLLAFFIAIMPNSATRILGRFLAFLWVDVFAIRKDVVYNNIDIAFPGTDSVTKKNWMRKSLEVLCRSFFDVLKIPSINSAWIEKNVVFHGLENIQDTPTGILFMSLHMASGDLAAACFSEKVKPLSLISKRFKNAFIDELWFSVRTMSKTEFIDAHGKNNAFDILKALKKNRGLVFVVDQFMGKPFGVETQFFGRTTGSAYGLALFAQKTKAPVHPLWTYWDENNKLNICVEPRIDFISRFKDDLKEPLNNELEDKNVILTNIFNKHIEEIIRKKPEQWMWVHRRWKVFE